MAIFGHKIFETRKSNKMDGIQFIKYPINSNDTIESVAVDLEIDAEYLQLIHNLNVSVYDKLMSMKGDFPSHLNEIYIHKEVNDAHIARKNEARPKNNPILEYNPIKGEKIYNVFYNFSDGESENNISFQTSIKSIENKSNINGHIVEIDRTSITLIDNEEPELVIDDLAIVTTKVIYPLQIIVNYRGNFVGIRNYEEIINRWEIVKENIHNNFEGQQTEKYISWTEETLQSKETLLTALKKDWFLKVYFAEIYIKYYSNYKINTTFYFPIISDLEGYEYKIVQEMNKYCDDESQLTISQTGKIYDEMNENNTDLIPINGEFDSKYLLDPIDKSLKNATINCSLDFITPKRLSITITQK